MLEQAEGDIKGVVIERGTEVFCMQIQALEFMAVQEKERESRCNKRQGQRTRFMSELAREATTCGICMVGEAMQTFRTEESHADALEQWIKDCYASSTFNVCDHQVLQAMSGPLLRIRVKEVEEPVALHFLFLSLTTGDRRCWSGLRGTASWW